MMIPWKKHSEHPISSTGKIILKKDIYCYADQIHITSYYICDVDRPFDLHPNIYKEDYYVIYMHGTDQELGITKEDEWCELK